MTDAEYLEQERKQLGCTRQERLPCSGKNAELRGRVNRSGAITYGWQCLDCGCWRLVKKTAVSNREASPPFDDDLARRVIGARQEKFRTDYQDEKQKKATAWWSRYDSYLKSENWKRKSAAVLKRDGKICRACATREASQAHHLSYEHVGDEPLFDLVAVCTECHDRITEMDRVRRETGKTPLDEVKS